MTETITAATCRRLHATGGDGSRRILTATLKAFAASPFGIFLRRTFLIQDRKTEAILSRRTLAEAQWARIEPLVPGKPGDPGRIGKDN